MTDATVNEVDPFSWKWAWIKEHPGKFTGIMFNIVFRLLFGLFFLLAGINKLLKGWMFSDLLEAVFLQRLTELDPASFAVIYLTEFAIPLYPLIAVVLTLGELAVGIGLIFGIGTRLASFGGFFILFNLAIGGYYDASLLPFFILNLVFIKWPSGHWLGFDSILHNKFPRYAWLMSK